MSNKSSSETDNSGWTLYLQPQPSSPTLMTHHHHHHHHHHHGDVISCSCNHANSHEDEEDDLSMVSDASSGPPHFHHHHHHDVDDEDDDYEVQRQQASINKNGLKRKANLIETHDFDDTASSPFFIPSHNHPKRVSIDNENDEESSSSLKSWILYSSQFRARSGATFEECYYSTQQLSTKPVV